MLSQQCLECSKTTLHPSKGQSLGTGELQRVVRNYEQDVVGALGSLCNRVREQGDRSTSLNKASSAVVASRESVGPLTVQAGRDDSSAAQFLARYPAIPVPALQSLEDSNLSLAATLGAIQSSQSTEEFHIALEQELDRISSPRELVLSPVSPTPTRGLQSSSLLQEFMAGAGL